GVAHVNRLQIEDAGQFQVDQQSRSERFRLGKSHPVLANDLVLAEFQQFGAEFLELSHLDPAQRFRVPLLQQFAGGKPHVAPQRDHFASPGDVDVRGKLLQRTADLVLHDLADPIGGSAVAMQVLPQPQRPQPVRVRIGDLAPLDQQQFGAAAPDFGDHDARLEHLLQFRQVRADAAVGDAVDLRLVERFDVEPGADVNAVQKRQPVRRLTHGTGRDHANVRRVGDLVLLQLLAVAAEDPYTLLD